MEPVEEEPGISLSSKLDQESEDHVDSFPLRSCLSDNADYTDTIENFCLPDAHSLLNVTSRRKNHKSRCPLPLDGDQSVEKFSEFSDLCFESETMDFNHGQTALQLSVSVEEIASQFELLRNAHDASFTVIEECLQYFFILSEILEIVKMLPWWCMMQLKSIVSGHKSININMSKKLKEVQLEKNVLNNQLYDIQMQIQNLKSDLENGQKIVAEQNFHHEMEKDELLSQILYLQKEVSQLSSSALAREKEALRKELDKSKSKLKDTDSKLKNVIQDKVKLEGEKAQAEREIKILQGQRAILERDILKHDSHLDKRHESRCDINKVSLMPVAQQSFQDDYEKLEFMSYEMEAEISSLKEALEIMICEKADASVKNDYLSSKLEAMEIKLNAANLEIELLKEELSRMDQKVTDSESFSRGLDESLDLLSREKDDMIMELTEALLEVESEKSGWTSKEQNLIEKLKSSNNEIVELSENLSEVLKELELCKGQCNCSRERLYPSEEITKSKDSSMPKSSGNALLCDDAEANEDEESNLQLINWQIRPACDEARSLRSAFVEAAGEGENLLSKVGQLRALEVEIETLERKYDDLRSNSELFIQELNQRVSSFELEMQEDAKESSELRKKLFTTQAKLDAYRGRLKEALHEMQVMDRNYREASTKLKSQLRTYGQHILNLTKQLVEKT